MIHINLTLLDLNKKEVDLYLEMLAIGSQAASILARKLSQPRSSTQFLAESLVKKGIATKQLYRHITTYQPLDPECLIRLLESKRYAVLNAFSERMTAVESIVSQLQGIQGNSSTRPQVRFFEGREGMKQVLEDSLTAGETIRALANFQERDRCLPLYFADYNERRVAKGVCIRTISPDSAADVPYREKAEVPHHETLLVCENRYRWFPEIRCYDDKVTIISGRDMLGVIIDGRDISRAMNVLFDLAWNGGLLEQERKGNSGKGAGSARPAIG